ncbi:uncharacterized protein N7469_011137 [Penicillium citrinum]|uniref:Uncharacterized protein n=1 Tax=Penicillium citrinum TaxID=5077 RepID=A0A9W9NCT8_PENCI|nr:uncharacterized protein N7469_011137 [Penicillium citrinum]KAJ5217512.1 hypothetical protein N7469_011137 [Penicillium citrinum]
MGSLGIPKQESWYCGLFWPSDLGMSMLMSGFLKGRLSMSWGAHEHAQPAQKWRLFCNIYASNFI